MKISKHPSAFTLVELLVVIAIIGILIAMLLLGSAASMIVFEGFCHYTPAALTLSTPTAQRISIATTPTDKTTSIAVASKVSGASGLNSSNKMWAGISKTSNFFG